MKENTSAFFCGLLFALGLGISGMTQPQKITAFLDLFGSWDPSLLFVMGGAVLVYSVGFRWVMRRKSPLFTQRFLVPTNRVIDRPLVTGAILFGIGWGLSGFCPGPALTSLTTLSTSSLVFCSSMLLGMFLFEFFQKRRLQS